ncbi:aldehyde dehydrogenase [Rhodoferax sp.]|uniref:aldehyde dehydrogenase n=1 Tax=Rhodoferax sp. TaxID=50421 RepID=UPI002ACDEAB4|nr:aldehyde dehydrogenase [Rhodoferax sp.]MDZ7920513.1 aldehyde dehydrogenase [Rhodoferax sp.]
MKQEQIDALREQPIGDGLLLIGGQWQPASDGGRLPVSSPIDGRSLCHLAAAAPADVDLAVRAARRSFESGVWSRMAPSERKKVLNRIADRIEAHHAELAVLGVRDNGTEIAMAWNAEPGSAAATFRYYAECVDKINGEIAPTPDGVLGLVHKEPVGVVAAIVPWNFPLMIGSWKIAPALAAGNSVVLKPSEEASLSLLRLAQLCLDAGLPEGVLNVVTGAGQITGDALAHHMDVDLITFTGSGPVGRQLMRASAQSNLKRVYLELGGKSPNIVFEDAPDLATAAKKSAMAIFRNSGQVCVAGSRLLVQRSVHDAFVEQLQNIAKALRVGDPLDVTTEVGAVSNARQLERNQRMLATAQQQGAQLRCGGNVIEPVPGGSYMRPAVLAGVQAEMEVAQQEVFGPVLAVMPFDDESHAVKLANGTAYGLASGVWTSNLSRAHRMVRAIKAGVVHVNTYGGSDLTVPLGGVRQSGNAHDKSLHALDKFLELKTAWIQL